MTIHTTFYFNISFMEANLLQSVEGGLYVILSSVALWHYVSIREKMGVEWADEYHYRQRKLFWLRVAILLVQNFKAANLKFDENLKVEKIARFLYRWHSIAAEATLPQC